MKQCPSTPRLDTETAADLSGHVWVQERPTGGEFRFQVAASGLLTFATAEGTFDAAASVPVPYRRAAEYINRALDRAALRAAADDPAAVTFCGIATWNAGVTYDWESIPAFVGTDVWSESTGTYLTPDTATGVFERLGLSTLPAVEKELPAAHTDFSQFEEPAGYPQSAWRDGRAAAVLIRDKSGGRAAARRGARSDAEVVATDWTAETLAAEYVTDDRIEGTVATLRDEGKSLTVARIRDRLLADLAREAHATLYPDGEFVATMDAFRSAVAERVQQHQFTVE